jgi:hypothetical protein
MHTHANLLAWCIEHNFSLVNLSFVELENNFLKYNNTTVDQFWSRNSILKNFFSRKFVFHFVNKLCLSDKWLRKLVRYISLIESPDNKTLHEDSGLKVECFKNKKILVVRAWDIQCPISLKKHQNKIRKIFEPKTEVTEFIKCFTNNLPSNDYLVGVHARRGDYASWQKGKYFYPWESYKKWIIELDKELILRKKKPTFIICSDERPPSEFFTNINCCFTNFDAITDLHLLATCDLQIGPPSSYGSWAEFYGKKKRICIHSKEQIISLDFLNEF